MSPLERERAELQARVDLHREELREAARGLGRPLRRVARLPQLVRRVAPLLPQAGVLVLALVVTVQVRRRRLRPLSLLMTVFDVWRLWAMLDGSGAAPLRLPDERARPGRLR
ncbi:MAG: hypothetical protein ACLGI7_06430 [Gammaproteobacteria bacterium]